MQDYYAILEVADTATADEIRKSYRRLSLKYPPDRNNGDPVLEEKFKEVNAVYQVLRDPEQRALYDWKRRSGYSQADWQHHQDDQTQFDAGTWKGTAEREFQPSRNENGLRIVFGFCLFLLVFGFKYCNNNNEKSYAALYSDFKYDTILVRTIRENAGRGDSATAPMPTPGQFRLPSPLPMDTQKYQSRLRELAYSSGRRREKPAIIYANDSCVLEGVVKFEAFKNLSELKRTAHPSVVQPLIVVELFRPIYLVDTTQANISTNYVESVQITYHHPLFRLEQFAKQAVRIECILRSGKEEFHAARALTREVYGLQKLER